VSVCNHEFANPITAEADQSLAELVAAAADRIAVGQGGLGALNLADPQLAEEMRELLPAVELLGRLGTRAIRRACSGDGGSWAESQALSLLGEFRIVRVIGRGGMGVVYEAVQESLNRRVALKMLPSLASKDPRSVRRFQIEAEAAAGLNHPHIVPVYMVGAENGLHYYAMQLIQGQTLAEVIREARQIGQPWENGECCPSPQSTTSVLPGQNTPLSPRMVAQFGRQAAEALHFAHQQGIIHRDIKPSNLLIDATGWLWVCDFGLATIAGKLDTTVTGTVLGTLRYMSPEQAFGTRAVVDRRTDIYSLGATLFELLTLRPVHEGVDRLELLRRIVDEEPRRPRRINPAIPQDLETMVLKALAKDPRERYATALDLAEDLGRFLQNLPILARPLGLLNRAARWSRRHGLAVPGGSRGA
jgi:serine/threonine protein kinase